MFVPSLLAKGLSRVLKDSRGDPSRTIVLGATDRYVIFSDHHKGAGTDADDFKKCKMTYLAALEHYWSEGYDLIILGDAEELWEESIKKVVDTHPEVFESEARFHNDPDRQYMRVFGNHDSNWASAGQVKKHLHPFFPNLEVHEGLVFRYEDADPDKAGEIFLVHGHQGTLDSEFLAPISRIVVRGVWRTIQILFKNTGTTPGNSAELRGEHDTLMYEWARQQEKLLLIAGHTHRSIWSSQTPVEQKRIELAALEYAHKHITPIPDFENEREKLKEDLRKLLEDKFNQLKNDTIKTEGCYFNSGCCSFSDGRVTAYELAENNLRLVEWEVDSKQRKIRDEGELGDLFELLSFS